MFAWQALCLSQVESGPQPSPLTLVTSLAPQPLGLRGRGEARQHSSHTASELTTSRSCCRLSFGHRTDMDRASWIAVVVNLALG